MRSRLALSALVIASMLGATAVASAQTQPAPGTTAPHMKSGKMARSSHKMKSGSTTGMSTSTHRSHKADKNKVEQNNMSK
jgi:uncharacterized low-complexity protein